MRAAAIMAVSAATFGCRRQDAAATLDSGLSVAALATATISADAAPSPVAPTVATVNETAAHDSGPESSGFEDQFEYGIGDDIDAGPDDTSLLAKAPHYASYTNGRFGFSLDVPTSFTAMAEPTNGDGMQWRLGHLVAMTASGMNSMPDVDSLSCNAHAQIHTASKSSCFSTGKHGGFIFWERHVIAHQIDFSLRFQYAESLKTAMDDIVAHVNKSWLH